MPETKAVEFRGFRFDGLQILRAVSMLLIALYHIDFMLGLGLRLDRSVHIFFVISAFITMYTTQKDTKNYGKKRIIRIVPLYWLLTVVTFFAAYIIPGVVPETPTVGELIKSLLFIPYSRSGIRSDGVIRPIVGPAHTLLLEMFFYLLIYIASKINHKNRGLITAAFITVLYAAGLIFDFYEYPILYTYTNERMLNFVFGIGLFYLLRFIYGHGQFRIGVWKSALLLLLSAAAAGILVSAESIYMPLKSGLASICVLSFAIAFFNIKSPRLLLFMGDISYSFYLIHYYVILVFKTFIDPMSVLTVKSAFCGRARSLSACARPMFPTG